MAELTPAQLADLERALMSPGNCAEFNRRREAQPAPGEDGVIWVDFSDPRDAADGRFHELVAWVDTFVPRFHLEAVIPPCWWQHWAILEELSALKIKRGEGYVSGGWLSDLHGLLVRPVRAIQVASPYRPREKALTGRPLRVVREGEKTVLIGTEPLGPSRVATVPRALLDAASRPHLVGGATRVAEALAAVDSVVGLHDLAGKVNADPAYRRIGSLASTLSLSVVEGLEPPVWRSLIELDRRARGESGWVDKRWGVAWPYPASELEAVVAA